MSPLSLIYLLMASPIFSTSNFETPLSSTWTGVEPSSWESWNTLPYSSYKSWTPEWFGEHSSSFEHLNWMLRKSVMSPRSILREMTGRHCELSSEWNMFESPLTMTSPKSLIKIVKVIRRLAETNPIVLEKMIRCPEVRFFVSKMLRHVEPETLILVEKLIRENIPVVIREKVTRRLVKNLIKSSVFDRHDEYSYSPRFNFESHVFDRHHNVESWSPKVMSKIIRRLVKSDKHDNVFENVLSHKYEKLSLLKKLVK